MYIILEAVCEKSRYYAQLFFYINYVPRLYRVLKTRKTVIKFTKRISPAALNGLKCKIFNLPMDLSPFGAIQK